VASAWPVKTGCLDSRRRWSCLSGKPPSFRPAWLNEVRVIGKPALCSSPDEVSVFILLGMQIGEKMNRDPRGTARSILTCVFAMLEHMDAASRDLERRLVVQRRLSGFEVRRVLTRHTKDAGPS